jgi:translation initiation factor IF-2
VDDKGRRLKSAGPSMPVEVLGLSGVPKAGDRLQVVPDEKSARQQAALYQRAAERNAGSAAGDVSLEDVFSRMKEGEVKDLNLVVKADVQGSIEPLVTSLQRLQEEGLRVKVIGSGTGSVTESDVMLASASKAIIVAFNVRAEPGARAAAETQHVDLRYYDVIYNVVEDVRKALVGLLGPRFREVVHGHAEIRQIFPVRKGGAAAGCLVTDGVILSNDSARVKRNDRVIWDGKIASLRRIKDEVREVSAGTECGILLDGWSDFRETDIIESYGQQEVTAI